MTPAVSRLPPRPRTRSPYDPKGFWLWDLLQSIALFIVAYIVAVFVYLVLIRISQIPQGQMWDESLRAPLVFVLVVGTTIVTMIPYFQKEWDRGLRMFSIYTALLLVAFASLSTTGIADPQIPLTFVSKHVMLPLRHLLHF